MSWSMGFEIIPTPLYKQLDNDEALFLERNPELLENVRALRQLVNQAWYQEHKGFSIALHQGKIIAKDKSSFEALNRGAELAGTDNIYLVTIDPMFINAEGDRDLSCPSEN